MAEYDLPAMVNYILNTTGNKQINYIAHSQGTLMGFAKFSDDLEFAKKVTKPMNHPCLEWFMWRFTRTLKPNHGWEEILGGFGIRQRVFQSNLNML